MKIELIKQTFDFDDNYKCTGYKYKPFKWCCEKIASNPVIDFIGEPTSDESDYNNIIPSIALTRMDIEYDYDSPMTWENYIYYKINHCPFCGEPIEISIVREEDVSDVYSHLTEWRDKLWKKHNRTDSKKKCEELEKEVRKLDYIINWFHDLNEYKDKSELEYEYE